MNMHSLHNSQERIYLAEEEKEEKLTNVFVLLNQLMRSEQLII